MSTESWNTLKMRVGEWSLRNFGLQPLSRRVVGAVEEFLGEFEDDPQDAVADMLIYLMDLAYAAGLDISPTFDGPPDIKKRLGLLAQSVLKAEQGIRPDKARLLEYRLNRLIGDIAFVYPSAFGNAWSAFEEIVSKRSWRPARVLITGPTKSGKTSLMPLINLPRGLNTSDVIKAHLPEGEYTRRELELYGDLLNASDPTYLVRCALEHGGVVAGVRKLREIEAIVAEGLFDIYVWMDRDGDGVEFGPQSLPNVIIGHFDNLQKTADKVNYELAKYR